MTRTFAVVLVIAAMSPVVRGAQRTFTGKISDEVCGSSHKDMAAATGISDRECALNCTRSGGKYVLVDKKGSVILIANQDFPALRQHPGHDVKLTGELLGDQIFVSKIAMVAKPK